MEMNGNKLLCACEKFRTETREIDCLCCQEATAISEEKSLPESQISSSYFIFYRSYKIVMTAILWF